MPKSSCARTLYSVLLTVTQSGLVQVSLVTSKLCVSPPRIKYVILGISFICEKSFASLLPNVKHFIGQTIGFV